MDVYIREQAATPMIHTAVASEASSLVELENSLHADSTSKIVETYQTPDRQSVGHKAGLCETKYAQQNVGNDYGMTVERETPTYSSVSNDQRSIDENQRCQIQSLRDVIGENVTQQEVKQLLIQAHWDQELAADLFFRSAQNHKENTSSPQKTDAIYPEMAARKVSAGCVVSVAEPKSDVGRTRTADFVERRNIAARGSRLPQETTDRRAKDSDSGRQGESTEKRKQPTNLDVPNPRSRDQELKSHPVAWSELTPEMPRSGRHQQTAVSCLDQAAEMEAERKRRQSERMTAIMQQRVVARQKERQDNSREGVPTTAIGAFDGQIETLCASTSDSGQGSAGLGGDSVHETTSHNVPVAQRSASNHQGPWLWSDNWGSKQDYSSITSSTPSPFGALGAGGDSGAVSFAAAHLEGQLNADPTLGLWTNTESATIGSGGFFSTMPNDGHQALEPDQRQENLVVDDVDQMFGNFLHGGGVVGLLDDDDEEGDRADSTGRKSRWLQTFDTGLNS